MGDFEELDEVHLNEDFSTVVIVDNIPIIGMPKFERLCGVIKRIFSCYGKLVQDGLFLPVNAEEGKTLGYAFIEYETHEMAKLAQVEGDNKKLDKEHKLRVTLWDQFAKFTEMPDEYEPPKKADFDNKVTLTSWLMDRFGRDQFVVRFGEHTKIYWNDPYRHSQSEGRVLKYNGEKEKDGKKVNWTESYVGWSPLGSYMATFHNPGIVVWGGDEFERLGRFMHEGVNVIAWSPSERYLVTSNGQDRSDKNPNWCMQIWDTRTQKLMRGFDKAESRSWPAFKWSHDDKYFARTGKGVISIYETPHMGLLDKKSFKAEGVQQIEWCPTQNVLAYWVPENGNVPAKVALMEVPSRKLLREKHLYKVSDVNMHWQNNGDYLCVKMSRKKTKKTTVQNFEIFRLCDKNIPVEILEMEDHVIAFSWEPNGSRFCLIHGNPARPDVSFYEMKKKTMERVKCLEQMLVSHAFWSPTGDHIVLAGLDEKNGSLFFVDTSDWTVTADTEHIMCTDVEWDPSGRFVITSVTQPIDLSTQNFRAAMENGYKLWSASGEPLQSISADQFYQILWRPRPKTLLAQKKMKEIKNTLKEEFWKIFESEDDEIKQSQLSGAARERQDWKDQWKAFRARAQAEHEAETEERIQLRHGLLSDDEDDYVDTEIVHTEEISREVFNI